MSCTSGIAATAGPVWKAGSTPCNGTAFRGLIEQLAAPRPLAEDIPDPRTAAQRNADALVELCDLARGNDQMSTAGGEPPHVTVTVDYETLIKQLAEATLDYGQRLSAAQTRLTACDSKIIPVVMSGASEPLDVGRAQRTVPLGIRHALIARDRGCRFPGCDRAGGDRDAEAIRHLDTADRIAPTRIRNDPIARDLVLTLDRRARRRTWELDSLRNRFGISAEGSLARGTACTPSGRNSP